jgi:ABC-type uncharacterized transport system substrate-binding protein
MTRLLAASALALLPAAAAARPAAAANERPTLRVALVLTRERPVLAPFLEAFEAACASQGAAMRAHSFDGRVERVDAVMHEIGTSAPDVVVGVFEQAWSTLVRRRGLLPPVPILHALTLDAPMAARGSASASGAAPGLTAALPIERMVRELRCFLPTARRLGIVCSERSRARVEAAHAKLQSEGAGVSLRVRTVERLEQVPDALRALLEEGIDCQLVLPDRLSAADGFLEQVVRACRPRGLPIVAPSREMVARGALLAFDADLAALGRQAAELALRAARDGAAGIGAVEPAPIAATANRSLAARCPGFVVPESAEVRWLETE